MKHKHCKTCKRILANHNKSGYCSKCYLKSPIWKKYQRDKQREYYNTNSTFRDYKIKYRKKNKKKYIAYQKEYYKNKLKKG